MQTTIMLLFYGFFGWYSGDVRRFFYPQTRIPARGRNDFRRWRHAVGLLLFDDFGLRIFVHTAVKSGGQ